MIIIINIVIPMTQWKIRGNWYITANAGYDATT